MKPLSKLMMRINIYNITDGEESAARLKKVMDTHDIGYAIVYTTRIRKDEEGYAATARKSRAIEVFERYLIKYGYDISNGPRVYYVCDKKRWNDAIVAAAAHAIR
jgi:hypothetical protein